MKINSKALRQVSRREVHRLYFELPAAAALFVRVACARVYLSVHAWQRARARRDEERHKQVQS